MEPLAMFGRLVAPGALALASRRPPRWLTILAYHRVMPPLPADYPFDREVVDCDPREFARQMELVARACTPIGLDEVLDFLASPVRCRCCSGRGPTAAGPGATDWS
ncbi:MAG TPA: hypothetical protein VFU21_32840 [Kofleriaceae bacterium]|nr:hypothetical protein [Kofleriaceae bacterium]